MEFQCLWLTTPTQFESWKTLLSHFPFPLHHLDYRNHLATQRKSSDVKISICIWSEEEFYQTPKALRKLLAKIQKPSLLVVTQSRFAYKAFELGFSHCLHKSELTLKLYHTVVEMLTQYFSSQNKTPFLQKKLWFTETHINDSMSFIPLDQICYITSMAEQSIIHTQDRVYQSTFPFLWLKIQCKVMRNFIYPSEGIAINALKIISVEYNKNEKPTLKFENEKTLLLPSKFGKYLLDFFKNKTL